MKPLSEAQAEVLAAVAALPAVRVPLEEAAGLALAESIVAPHDLPPFANSAMDGYAVIAADVAPAPVTLELLGGVAAGTMPTGRVRPGTAIQIMTGAPVPEGADAVVPVEDTEAQSGAVRILTPVPAGASIRAAGGDVIRGTTVLSKGERLTPARLGVCASLGFDRPLVGRRPRVAIMSTGDEIVPPETKVLAPGKIRDANRYTLRGALGELGAEVIDFGIVGDDTGRLRQVLGAAAAAADVVVSSGGVSMGEYDVVKLLLREMGSVEFWRIAMKPAKPLGFGRVGGKPFFGLPGNPVSVAVAFEQFLRPALLHMMGSGLLFRGRVRGIIEDDAHTDPAKEVFLRVTIRAGDDGVARARLSGGQDSNVLTALAAADGFAVVPVGVADIAAGSALDLELIRNPEARSYLEVLGG